jgi:O-antigen/teichoic acid export membrane protein
VILGPAAVTYLAVPMRLTSALETGFNSLVGVIFPHISALRAQGNTESLKDIYARASKYIVALSTPVFLFIILFSRQILAVWLGREFSGRAWPVLSVLSCASLLAVWTMVPANTIYGTGDTKVAATFGAIVSGLNLLFSVLLTVRYGIFGTGAAVLITALQCPIFIWYVTSRVLKFSPAQYYEQVFAPHLVPATVFSAISLIILSLTDGEASRSSLFVLAFGSGLSVLYYSFLLKFRFVYLNDLKWSG